MLVTCPAENLVETAQNLDRRNRVREMYPDNPVQSDEE